LLFSIFAAGCDGCDDDDDDDNDDDDTSPPNDDDNDAIMDDDFLDDDDDTSSVTIERVWGGAPGHTGTEIVETTDGRIHVAAVKGRALVLYSFQAGGEPTETEIAAFAQDHTLAADSAGNLHLAYTEIATHNLVYRTNAGGSWSKQTVLAGNDDHDWGHASLALDGQDRPHLAFYDEYLDTDEGHSAAGVRYAEPAGDSWNIQEIDDTDHWMGAKDITLALDAQGGAHLAYYNMTKEELRYATNVGGDWTITTVDSGEEVGEWCSIAIDGDGHVHLAYTNDSDGNKYGLYYATDKTGAWVKQKLGSQKSSSFRSLGLDAAGHVFIVCTQGADGVALWTDLTGSWEQQAVDSANSYAMFASLFIDAGGAAHIAYHDEDRGWLNYAGNATGVWALATIDDAGQIKEPASLALDPDGNPFIAMVYGATHTAEGALVLVSRQGKGWSGEIVDADLWSNYEYTALAVDPTGGAHLVYSGRLPDLGVTYATNAGDDWTYEDVDNRTQIPDMVTIALDNAGAVHAVYVDSSSSTARLRYATNASGNWTAQTVANADGEYSDLCVTLQVEGDGTAHVAWYDDDSETVYYADNAAGNWAKVTIQDDLSFLDSLSIQLDGNGAAHLVFSDYYATNASGAWSVDELNLYSPNSLSLALDAADRAHLAFECSGGLCYGSNVSGQWETRRIDNLDGDYYILRTAGDFPSLALDDAGNAHVAYLGESAVWYATFPADAQ